MLLGSAILGLLTYTLNTTIYSVNLYAAFLLFFMVLTMALISLYQEIKTRKVCGVS
jgi:hypothetical protein